MSSPAAEPQHFLEGQSFSELASIADANERQGHVCGHVLDESPKKQSESKIDPWQRRNRAWMRSVIVGEKPPTRVAFVSDAGLGKSTNMGWLDFEIANQQSTPRFSLLLRLDDAVDPDAESTPHIELLMNEAKRPGSLSEWFITQYAAGNATDERKLRQRFQQLQNSGNLTLLIDGLDHAMSVTGFADALKLILNSPKWAYCPIWVAGRPYAFKSCWEKIFADPHWKFLKVNPLGEGEIREYMRAEAGGDYYDALIESRELLAVPRFLQLICRVIRRAIPKYVTDRDERAKFVEQLDMRTPADVYFRAYFTGYRENEVQNSGFVYGNTDTYGLIAQGLVGKAERIGLDKEAEPCEENFSDRIERTADLVGAIAYHMMGVNSAADEPEPNTTGLDLTPFRERVKSKPDEVGLGSLAAFDRDIGFLKQMNNRTLDCLMFREVSKTRWAFHDRTAQAFFAAYWSMKKCPLGDFAKMEQWKLAKKEDKLLPGYEEFWRFVGELPDLLIDKERWMKAVSPSYKPPHELTGTLYHLQWHRRMVYHSFRRMSDRDADTVAKWRSKWLALGRGEGSKADLGTYRELVNPVRYCRCPQNPADDGVPYRMGSPETEEGRDDDEVHREVKVVPFQMRDFPITNVEYELFDPSHQQLRDKYSDQPSQPVINVSWYDAWCFATWCVSRLPTEEEWEYACRAGTTTPFWFGNEIDAKRANFVVKVGKTTERGAYNANPWGLFDMHGNVYDWCDSRYAAGASARVLRGGSWFGDAWDCRSADRFRAEPGYRDYDCGFRLAAVPVCGATSSKR